MDIKTIYHKLFGKQKIITAPYTIINYLDKTIKQVSINGVLFSDEEEILVKYALDTFGRATLVYRDNVYDPLNVLFVLDYWCDRRSLNCMSEIKKYTSK